MPDIKDVWVNQAYLTVIESAPNTLTFNQLLTNVSIHEKIGWLLSRIDYTFSILGANFGAEGDGFTFGLSVSDQIAAVGLDQSAVIDHNTVARTDFGVAASGFLIRTPFSKSFADLPGGGILVPPNPIFIYAQGTALGAAITVMARMFYLVKSLKVEDFWELVELRRMIGA